MFLCYQLFSITFIFVLWKWNDTHLHACMHAHMHTHIHTISIVSAVRNYAPQVCVIFGSQDIPTKGLKDIHICSIFTVCHKQDILKGKFHCKTVTVFTRWSDCGVEPGRWVRSVFWCCIDPRLHNDPIYGADPATGADRTRARCLHYKIINIP